MKLKITDNKNIKWKKLNRNTKYKMGLKIIKEMKMDTCANCNKKCRSKDISNVKCRNM